MANKTPSAASTPLHSTTGKLLGTESTTLAAGDTILVQNSGDTVVHINATTAGTGTVKGLITPGNDQAITIGLGNNLFGPYDQAIFGQTLTITTATAVGSVGLYHSVPRLTNGLHNPFETSSSAPDA
jgi:hypothetical protein